MPVHHPAAATPEQADPLDTVDGARPFGHDRISKQYALASQLVLSKQGPTMASAVINAAPGLSLPRVTALLRSPQLRRLISPLALIGLWQIGSSLGLIPANLLASPAHILTAAWDLTITGKLPYHLMISLRRVSIGLVLGATIGGGLAVVASLSRWGEDIVDPPMQMLRTLPFLALVPLFILWFGIDELPKVLLVAFGAAFPLYVTVFAGIRGIDPKLIEAARIFGLDHRGLIREVILPGALPSTLVGLRYAIGVAWLSLVVGEQVNSSAGIGYLISDARDFLRTDIIVVGLLVYALLGLLTDGLVRAVERRALAWRPDFVRS
jgi:sulfonate transport system permease protein